MNKYIGRHIFGIVLGGMICFISACNNDSVSEKQAESFLKYYAAGTEDNSGTVVIQTSTGYTIMGNIEGVSGNKDIFVVLTDEFGRQVGETIEIGTDFIDHGYSMIRLGDGYLIAGSSFNSNTAQKKGYLVNISSDGQLIWERTYSGYQELEFRDVYYPTSDGHIIITGYSKNTTGDGTEAIIFKTETDGDSSWCKTYSISDNDNDVGEAIIEYQNRYHVLTTSTDERDINLSHIWILNTNTDGRAETNEPIKTDYISGKDMILNTAGQIYILGNSEDPVSRISKIFLAELELYAGGQLTRLRDSASIPYTESLHAESFTPVGQDRLAIGGWQGNLIDSEILFLLVDNGFQPQMLKTYGSTKGAQNSKDILYTSDNGYSLTGAVDLAGGKTSMLLKTGSDGELK